MTTIRAGDVDADKIHVLLDGVEIKDCFAVNAEEGWADVYVVETKPLPYADEWPSVRKYGVITIVRDDPISKDV